MKQTDGKKKASPTEQLTTHLNIVNSLIKEKDTVGLINTFTEPYKTSNDTTRVYKFLVIVCNSYCMDSRVQYVSRCPKKDLNMKNDGTIKMYTNTCCTN